MTARIRTVAAQPAKARAVARVPPGAGPRRCVVNGPSEYNGRRSTTRIFGKSVMTGKIRRSRVILLGVIFGTIGAALWGVAGNGLSPFRPEVALPVGSANPDKNVVGDDASTTQGNAPSPLALAVAALESRQSVSAKLRYEAQLFGHRLLGSGFYVEQRPGRDHLFRLELRLQLGDRPSSFVCVCDGRYLWEYRNWGARAELSRVDIVRAWRALEREDEPLAAYHAMAMPGLGGLTRLLRQLDKQFVWAEAQRGRWDQPPTIVWRIVGRWKTDAWARVANGAIQEGDSHRVPAHVPDQVVCYLGEADRFPYRLEFRRAANGSGEDLCLLAVDFYEIRFDEAIDPTLLRYQPPGDTEFSDQTENFIRQRREGIR